jgi:hypothetical protein
MSNGNPRQLPPVIAWIYYVVAMMPYPQDTIEDEIRRRRDVEAAARAAWHALVDLTLEQKFAALELLVGLVTMEEASGSDEAITGRWQ